VSPSGRLWACGGTAGGVLLASLVTVALVSYVMSQMLGFSACTY
jgi:hypothetical protein